MRWRQARRLLRATAHRLPGRSPTRWCRSSSATMTALGLLFLAARRRGPQSHGAGGGSGSDDRGAVAEIEPSRCSTRSARRVRRQRRDGLAASSRDGGRELALLHRLEPRRHGAVLHVHRLRGERGRRPHIRARLAAPVLGRSDVDPYFATSPWVMRRGRTLAHVVRVRRRLEPTHDGVRSTEYHIKYAESDDGLAWRPTGHVCIDFADEDEYAIARPCVVRDGDRYRMWFSHRGAALPDRLRRVGRRAQLGAAGRRRRRSTSRGDGWDREMVEYPCVFDHGDAATCSTTATATARRASAWRCTRSRSEQGISRTSPSPWDSRCTASW